VCANASRYIDDPRVLVDDSPLLSAGWKYFEQVHIGGDSFLVAASLFDLQMRCVRAAYPLFDLSLTLFQLAMTFLQGSSIPQTSWLVIGIGIRIAQDVGAHRRKIHERKPSILGEQWKRAFWSVHTHSCVMDPMNAFLYRCLVLYDRFSASILGRACSIQDEELVS
jgi:hypothetical protein